MSGAPRAGDASPGREGADGASTSRRMLDGMRAAARWIRRLPDRVLHPHRRRRARRRLGEAPPRGPVLFVCHGNICRSPYAEMFFRQRARGRTEAASVGLTGPGRPSPETAREVARERGVELEDHRSRLVTDASLREAGVVAVMNPGQSRALRRLHGFGASLVLGDLDPQPIRRRSIRDPIFQPPDVFREVYDRIDRCVDGMIDAMGLPVGGAAAGGSARDGADMGGGTSASGATGEGRPTGGRDTA